MLSACLDQCIAFYLGQTLTYDKVLEVLGAVDTEVFSKLLRRDDPGRCDQAAIHILEELIVGGRELGQFVGDFTWYMRNLLLVKTSEEPEEAIDVSSENMTASERREYNAGCGNTDALYPYFFRSVQPDPLCCPEKSSGGDCPDQAMCSPAMETNLGFGAGSTCRVLEQRMDEETGTAGDRSEQWGNTDQI